MQQSFFGNIKQILRIGKLFTVQAVKMNIKKVIKLLIKWLQEKKVGNVQINVYKGGISSVNLNETIKE